MSFNIFNRLGSVPNDGLARLCGHPGLEHVLPHPGNSHLKDEDVTASPQNTSFSLGIELSGEAQELTTYQGLTICGRIGAARRRWDSLVRCTDDSMHQSPWSTLSHTYSTHVCGPQPAA